jgi:uncharacterized membrane protein
MATETVRADHGNQQPVIVPREDGLMNLNIVRFVNLLLSSTMVGNEFGGWLAVHPALSTLPLTSHVQAEQAIVRRYGRIMPVWMTAAILSCIAVLSNVPDRRSPAFRYTLGGMLCFLGMLGVTFIGNMPINAQILAQSTDVPPSQWHALRKRWDQWHTLRNVLNFVGLGLLYAGVLRDPNPQEKM